jgi:hypothetical protein
MRDSAPALPPPPEARQSILDAITPGPAAFRREVAPDVRAPGDDARRRSDSIIPPPARAPSVPPPSPPSSASLPPLEIAPTIRRDNTGIDPPPTRIHRPDSLADRPFTPPQLTAVPEIPEPGLLNAARYATRFARARFQRRGAI